MIALEFIDAIRYAHLLSVAVGLGAATFADFQLIKHLNRPVGPELEGLLADLHQVIWLSLAGMWLTGIYLIAIRTGMDLAHVTPKLVSKLGIVALLTLNAVLIGRLAPQLLARAEGQPLLDLPLRDKIMGTCVGALSSGSWLLALALGSSKVLATQGWATFAVIVPGVYALAFGSAISLACVAHLWRSGRVEGRPAIL